MAKLQQSRVKIQHQGGFTLVELLLSMAIFSFGLLVVVSATLTLMALFRHGSHQKDAQLAVRSAMDRMVQTAHASNGMLDGGTGAGPICMIGANKIYYLDSIQHRLYESDWNPSALTCSQAFAINTPVAITSDNVWVVSFIGDPAQGNPATGNVVNPNTQVESVRITLRVTNPGAKLITPSNTDCDPKDSSCAVVALTTTATTRQNNFVENQNQGGGGTTGPCGNNVTFVDNHSGSGTGHITGIFVGDVGNQTVATFCYAGMTGYYIDGPVTILLLSSPAITQSLWTPNPSPYYFPNDSAIETR